MRRFRSALTLLLATALGALGLAACGEKSEPEVTTTGASESALSVTVQPQTARPGGMIAARVINDTEQKFTYGANYELERRGPNGFVLFEQPNRAVIQIAYEAQPGEVGPPVRVQVPAAAEPGQWRVVIQRDVPGVGDLAGAFTVTR